VKIEVLFDLDQVALVEKQGEELFELFRGNLQRGGGFLEGGGREAAPAVEGGQAVDVFLLIAGQGDPVPSQAHQFFFHRNPALLRQVVEQLVEETHLHLGGQLAA